MDAASRCDYSTVEKAEPPRSSRRAVAPAPAIFDSEPLSLRQGPGPP